MTYNKTSYGIQCNYVISTEIFVNNSIWPLPPPCPKLVCVPDITGKQQICKLILNISHPCQFHKVQHFGLCGKDLKARRSSIVKQIQYFSSRNSLECCISKNRSSTVTQGQGKFQLFVPECLVHNSCSIFTEWMGLHKSVRFGLWMIGIMM